MKIENTRTEGINEMLDSVVYAKKLQDGTWSTQKLSNPFIVVKAQVIKVVSSIPDLLDYTDKTQVILQWHGQWKSDYFSFTVKQFKDWLKGKS